MQNKTDSENSSSTLTSEDEGRPMEVGTIESGQAQQNTRADGSEDAALQARKQRFDRRLPIAHSYLNANRRQLLAEDGEAVPDEEPGGKVTVPGG